MYKVMQPGYQIILHLKIRYTCKRMDQLWELLHCYY